LRSYKKIGKNPLADATNHRKCRSTFTLKRDLETIMKKKPK